MGKDMKKHIRESNLIEGIDDPKEDKQALKAWKYLERKVGVNETVILELHRLITRNQLSEKESGHWRTIQVYVGKHTPTPPAYVPSSMGYWLHQWLELTPKQSHVSFEKIHPFVDGNGRTGRMLMWWHEQKLGQEPTLILNKDKQDYYKWFAESK